MIEKKRFLKYIALSLILVSLFLLAACDKGGKEEAGPESRQESQADEQSGPAEKESASIKMEAENDGPAPDKDSDFARLADEEKIALIGWLEQVGESYNEIAEALNELKSGLISFNFAENSWSDSDLYLGVKEKIESAVAKIENYPQEDFSAASEGILKKAKEMNAFFTDLIRDLADISAGDALFSFVEGRLEEALDKMQGFLDELQSFRS